MRKLFLIPLLACFACVNMWAAPITVGTGGDHSTLADAVTQSNDGDEIVLMSDISVTTPVNFNKNLTLNTNGFTFSNSDKNVIVVNTPNKILTIVGDGTLTTSGRYTILINNASAKVVLNGSNITGGTTTIGVFCNKGTFEMNGGRIEVGANASCIYTGPGNVNKVVINGGYLSGNWGVNMSKGTEDSYATLTINGGEINGSFLGIAVYAYGHVNVNGGIIRGISYALSGNGTGDPNNPNYGAHTVINISGGSLIESSSIGGAIYHPQIGTISISGNAYIEGATGLEMCSGTGMIANISGGKIVATGEDLRTTNGQKGQSSGFLAVGGAVVIVDRDYPGGLPSIAITSGTFISEQSQAIMAYTWEKYGSNKLPRGEKEVQAYKSSYWDAAPTYLVLRGGVLSQDPSAIQPVVADGGAKTQSYIMAGYNVVPTTYEGKTMYMVVKGDVVTAQDFMDETSAEVVKLEATTPGNALAVTVGDDIATETAQTAEYVEVAENVTLTVKDNATLNVGNGGLVLAEENSKLEVEAGGTVVVGTNGIISTSESNIVLNVEETSTTSGSSYTYSTLLLDPNVTLNTTPLATYRFTSKSSFDPSTNKTVYQRFGMPVASDSYVNFKYANAADQTAAEAGTLQTYICHWDYDADAWSDWDLLAAGGNNYASSAVMPFLCYEMVSNNDADHPVTYEFSGRLMGNTDAPLNFHEGWNPYANSYTAPINTESFLNRIVDAYAVDDNIQATIYLYIARANNTYRWQPVNLANSTRAAFSEIKPMQAFIMLLQKGSSAAAQIDYAEAIYNPAMGIAAAPARRSARPAFDRLAVRVEDAAGLDDEVTLMESARFSSALDNGYDSRKYMNDDVNIYAMDGDNRMSDVATDDVEGLFLGFETKQAGVYTLSFPEADMSYALRDMATNTVINMTEGATYTFSAEAGADDYRFQVVAVRPVTTAMDYIASDINIWTANNTLYVADNSSDIRIFAMNGQLVMNIAANGETIQAVNLDGLHAGAYLVRVADKSLKIVK